MYCNKCGSEIPADCEFCIQCGAPRVKQEQMQKPGMHCNKCGSEIPDGCKFCVRCGAPKAQPVPVKETSAPQPRPVYTHASAHQSGLYGSFGGLIISGALILMLLVIGASVHRMFLSVTNTHNIFMQFARYLPIGFAAALTVRTMGLDLSVAGMVSLSAVIFMRVESLAVAVVLALVVCIVIGVINAVCIYFLKLPAILVTLATLIIVSFITLQLGRNVGLRPVELAPAWTGIAVIASIVLAVALALLTSLGKQETFAASVLPVYAGSGIFAVLSVVMWFVRLEMATYIMAPVNTVLIIGLLMSITRFHKNKALGVVFSFVPVLMCCLLSNVLIIVGVDPYLQGIIMIVLILALIGVVLHDGRSAVVGQSFDDGRKRTWIALAPLLIYLLIEVVIQIFLLVNTGRPSNLYFQLTGTSRQVVLLLITIGFSVWYALCKPRCVRSER